MRGTTAPTPRRGSRSNRTNRKRKATEVTDYDSANSVAFSVKLSFIPIGSPSCPDSPPAPFMLPARISWARLVFQNNIRILPLFCG